MVAEPIEVIKKIYDIAYMIYKHVEQVKANQRQCKRLSERVLIVEQAVRGLEKVEDKAQYLAGLMDLLTVLQEAETFIKKFLASSRWERWLLKVGNHQETFSQLTEELFRVLPQLNLGMVAQQIMNREQDREDQRLDNQFIKEHQQEIIKLNMAHLQEMQALRLAQQEQQEVLALQLKAIQSQLRVVVQPAEKQPPAKPSYEIPYYDLVFDKLLAEGSFGKIYIGQWEGRQVVIKAIEGKTNGELTEAEQSEFKREVQIMSRLQHPNITKFYGACLEEGHACLVMEYMEEGSLDQFLGQNEMSPQKQKAMALDILKGLEYLHKKEVLHCDLKSGNILVNAKGVAKISDFGLSKINTFSVRSIRKSTDALAWQAPETFGYPPRYERASDVYSFGVLLWELLTQKTPDFDNSRMDQYKGEGARLEYSGLPMEDILRLCWQQDAKLRPTATVLLQKVQAYQPPSADDLFADAEKLRESKAFMPAFKTYQKAAELGNVKALGRLGNFYLQPPSSEFSESKQDAFQCFLKAAEQGHARSMFNVGMMMEYGDGTTENKREALNWYEKTLLVEPDHEGALQRVNKLSSRFNIPPSYQIDTVQHNRR